MAVLDVAASAVHRFSLQQFIFDASRRVAVDGMLWLTAL